MSGAVPPLSTYLRGEHIDSFNLSSSAELVVETEDVSNSTQEFCSCMSCFCHRRIQTSTWIPAMFNWSLKTSKLLTSCCRDNRKRKLWDYILKWTRNIFLHIFSNSLSTRHPTIRHYILWATRLFFLSPCSQKQMRRQTSRSPGSCIKGTYSVVK